MGGTLVGCLSREDVARDSIVGQAGVYLIDDRRMLTCPENLNQCLAIHTFR